MRVTHYSRYCDICGAYIDEEVSSSDMGSNRSHYCSVCMARYEAMQGVSTIKQPPPKGSKGDVWLEVISDMDERRIMGIEKYRVPLQPHNGRDALVDAYQEALDLCVYLKQAIIERSEQSENI